jgi:hypothetical protein
MIGNLEQMIEILWEAGYPKLRSLGQPFEGLWKIVGAMDAVRGTLLPGNGCLRPGHLAAGGMA